MHVLFHSDIPVVCVCPVSGDQKWILPILKHTRVFDQPACLLQSTEWIDQHFDWHWYIDT